MRIKSKLRNLFANLFRRAEIERDLDDELNSYVDELAERKQQAGLSPIEARRAALVELGGVSATAEMVRSERMGVAVESWFKDVRHAYRSLRKQAGFSALVITVIGVAIGACTAMFSVVHAVLLRPLPYSDPSRLVLLWGELRARNVPDFAFPIPDLQDLRLESKTLESVAGLFPPARTTLGLDDGHPEQIRTAAVTSNLLTVLGASILYGRDFSEEDATPQPQNPTPLPPAEAVPVTSRLPLMTILNYDFWMRKYGGDPGVVGQMMDLGGDRAQIVGVLSPGFKLLMPPRTGIDPDVDVWTAPRLNYTAAQRNTGALRVIARLKPGVSLAAAQADAEVIAAEMRDRYAIRKSADVHWRVVPMHDDLVGEVRTSILALFGAVIFVLLIACANVANLFLVRAASRHRELVIRAAIGGSRWRLVREMLVESFLLAGGGAVVGLFIAQGGMDILTSIAPAQLPLATTIRLDPIVLLFSGLATIVTTLLFGVVPAIRASRPDVAQALRAGGAAGLRGGRVLRRTVAVTELALSFILLIGFGLMVRSFNALKQVDPGFDPKGVLTFQVQPSPRGNIERALFSAQLLSRLRAIAGVESVSAASRLPLDGTVSNGAWATEAGAVDPSLFRQANFHIVLPGYFETLKIPVLAGRTFTDDDNTPATTKVVIDDVLAAVAFPNSDAVGKTLLVHNLRANGPAVEQNVQIQVLGVVRHQRDEAVTIEGREGIYFVEQYFGGGRAGRWAIRTAGDPVSIGPAVRAAIAELDPKTLVSEMKPLSAYVATSTAPTRFATMLIGVFTGVAVLLAAAGLYGVLSTVVRQRTAEIGMRMAFGASQRNILSLVLVEGLHLSLAAMVVGFAGALIMTRFMRSMLVAVTPTDVVTFAVVTMLFFLIAACASWLPARRASQLNPCAALREE